MFTGAFQQEGRTNEGAYKKTTHFSLSPSHIVTMSDEETEKKEEFLASVATALAK